MLYKLLQPVGPLELDLVAWFACGSCTQPGKPALCGSRPLVTPYYCRLGDLLCFVFMSAYCAFDFFCVLFVPSVLWYCWLGLLTCKTRLPYNLYCVGGDVKHCSIQSKHAAPARLRQRPTFVNNQIATCLLCHCSRTACCCSQPAGWYRPTACGRTDRPEVTTPHLWKNVIIFVTTTPTDIKLSTYPAHGRYASACQISPSYDAAFRRR